MHKKKITPTGALLYVFLTVVLVFMMIPETVSSFV